MRSRALGEVEFEATRQGDMAQGVVWTGSTELRSRLGHFQGQGMAGAQFTGRGPGGAEPAGRVSRARRSQGPWYRLACDLSISRVHGAAQEIGVWRVVEAGAWRGVRHREDGFHFNF